MRRVNLQEFRKEVVTIIEANRDKVSSFEAKDDFSIFTFCGNNYACEVTLASDWIGYDLGIETAEGMVGCGMEYNNDGYPAYGEGNETVTLKVYDDLLATVNAIFNDDFYYSSEQTFSYTAKRNSNGTYTVDYWQRKKFLFWPYSSGQTSELNEKEFKKLGLQVLS